MTTIAPATPATPYTCLNLGISRVASEEEDKSIAHIERKGSGYCHQRIPPGEETIGQGTRGRDRASLVEVSLTLSTIFGRN